MQHNNIPKYKQESREIRNGQWLTIESQSNNSNNIAILSKSVDSKGKEGASWRMNQTVPVSQIVQINTHNPPEFIDHSLKDSPYTSSYASKGRRKKSKDTGSKDSLRKSIHKRESKGMYLDLKGL